MKQLKKHTALLVCLALFLTALVFSFFLSRDDVGDFRGDGSGHIVLSEILASNRTYPSPNGAYLDLIEIRNITATPTDISGYMLADALDSIGYTIPQGTVLPAYGHLVVWCDKSSESGKFAPFGISSTGGETIYLYNRANVIVDSVTVPRMNTNMPLIRLEDGTWQPGIYATPGFENTEEGYQAWLSASGAIKDMDVVISEIMTANDCTALDAQGTFCDWVELWNTGKQEVDLTGAYLSDDPTDAFKWQIPQLILPAGERAVVRCAGNNAGLSDATFALPANGCTVVLTGIRGNTISSVAVPAIGRDISWALQENGDYARCAEATPGYSNDTAGYQQWLHFVAPTDIQVVISEVMTSNRSTITNTAGALCDWVELQNIGSSPAVLDGVFLSDDPDCRGLWQIDSMTLQPGETAVIPCGGAEAAPNELPFSLKKSGCTLILSGPMGNILQTLEVPSMEDDRSLQRLEDGRYVCSDMPSPGYANDDAGRQAFLASMHIPGPLMISEVMPSNAQYLQQLDGKYYDWVELKNISNASIDLSDYCLSDNPDFPGMFQLPKKVLKPGQRVIIICSDNTELTGNYIYAPFTLSRKESWIYVSHTDGSFCDFMRIYDVPYQGSVGRVTGKNGTYYFTEPTPGTENGTGVAFISGMPTILTADGVYNNVDSVAVHITGPGQIRYTLDGSIPDADSNLYTGPITLDSTTVVRVGSFEQGKLPSDIVTAAYIIDENHTLPVVSLTVDPEEMFGGNGLYVNYYTENEIRCNMKLFDGNDGFTIDCGIKMFGHMGLENPKKSFKINFRGRYGEKMLHYPLYGEDAPQFYDSLVVRSGQDYPLAIFRDELFTSLARDSGDNVLAQEDKHCILYINGQYWGIYCIKEAFCETMVANHYNVSEDSVEIVQAPVHMGSEMLDFIFFCEKADMNDPETWEYVSSRIDLESLMDWMILEAYATNPDTQQNLRYFRSTELGSKWMFAYYDIDWGWHYDHQFAHVLGNDFSWQHLGLTKHIIQNKEFRKMFLERLSSLLETTLSDAYVMARIEYYVELLDPEVRRERDRWGSSYEGWQFRVQQLRDFLQDGHIQKLITRLEEYIQLTPEEMDTYFGRWID